MEKQWDIIVVGGGHAGCEAALAAVRMGKSCLLLTMQVSSIAAMSCNPAIGGIAKGHLVKEIDALGGGMGKIADATAIQFRILNKTKGEAVQATRCQSDQYRYAKAMQSYLFSFPSLQIYQGEAASLLLKKGQVHGIRTTLGEELHGKAVVLTAGTFLQGLIHIGKQQIRAGRDGEGASMHLSEQLTNAGLEIGRLKTGTPPRIDGRSIDFSKMEKHESDPEETYFSFWGKPENPLESRACHITYTNAKTHTIVADNLAYSAMYSGEIKGIGPRYCPSIEDKIARFPHKERHQIFIEPTGLDSYEYYPNGLSTSLPVFVQEAYLKSIEGMENTRIIRPGYAIEYDYVKPTQLKATLETKTIHRLYCAGQINGTSGYEEAAAQGLIAGMNAVLSIEEKEPFILQRFEAYIGVLIDDLITKGTDEPYRMFTSRAEYRLLLREDNADQRLSAKAYDLGALPQEKYDLFLAKQEAVAQCSAWVKTTSFVPTEALNLALIEKKADQLTQKIKVNAFLKRSQGNLAIVEETVPELASSLVNWDSAVKKYVSATVKYEGYIQRQELQIKKSINLELRKIPEQFSYEAVGGLSAEVLSKLASHKPQTIGQASRISGVTPSAIAQIIIALDKGNYEPLS